MGKVMLKFLVGGVAGLLVWMIMDPSTPSNIASRSWESWERTFILLLGALIGFAVGGLEGFTRGGKVHTVKGLGFGLVFGAIGATFGSAMGTALVTSIFHGSVFLTGNIAQRIPARIIAFIPIGMFLGAAIGGSSLNAKRTIQGMIGGALGAAISGLAFDPFSDAVGNAILSVRGQHEGEVGGPARALTAILLGSMIALFIGLVERFSRSAWLRLSLGRNEGKEWSIDGQRTFIGRSESAAVPLFGDPNVAPVHASIDRQGSNYILQDAGSPIGTYLNGQRVMGQALLFQGAQIQIGSFILQFLLKNAPAPYAGPEVYGGQAYPIGGQAAYHRQPVPMPNQMPQPVPQQLPHQLPQTMQQMPQQMPYGQPSSNPTQVISPAGSMPTMAYGASPAHQPSGFALVALDGPLLGQRFSVSMPIEVGRDCPSIPMSFDTVASRKHASLSPAFNGVSVQDFGSTNGTFLNGQRVSQATASPGDMLKIGSTTFRVETA